MKTSKLKRSISLKLFKSQILHFPKTFYSLLLKIYKLTLMTKVPKLYYHMLNWTTL